MSSSVRLVFACLWIGAAGCGSSGEGGSFDPESSPYGERTPTTQASFAVKSTGTLVDVSADPQRTTEVVGQKTVGSATYDRMAIIKSDGTQTDEYWLKTNPDNTVECAGIDLQGPTTKALLGGGTLALDPPVKLNIDAPVGAAQTLSVSGSFSLAGTGVAVPVTATGQYTLVEKDAVVQTDMGPLSGCNHYTGSISSAMAALPEAFRTKPLTGELWFHPSFGVVAFNAPDLGLSSTMKETNDCGATDASGHRTIRKVAIVDATNSDYELSVYNCTGGFFADKTVHAKMLLEMRFADETLAKTATEPANVYKFRSVFGTFGAILTQSPVSILHPEENGKGYVYWIAYVDQAAKNGIGDNGISYGVTVTGTTTPVRASARIYYKVFP